MTVDIKVSSFIHEGQRKDYFVTQVETDENLSFLYQKTLETLRLLFPKATIFYFNIHL